tara:strand:+ start:250 stop:621 length:372 start_codon:yes stop_codon:yes gene_type:complete
MAKEASLKTDDYFYPKYKERGGKFNKKEFRKIVSMYCIELGKDFMNRGFVKLPKFLGTIELFKFHVKKMESWKKPIGLKPVWRRSYGKSYFYFHPSKTVFRKMYKDYDKLVTIARFKKTKNDL